MLEHRTDDSATWWRDASIYQVYPRSFSDSDGDGIGDLRGVAQRLDYLAWLGVDAVWLNPINPSPNADWGYDVSDYTDVDPELGTLAELDLLVREARRRGIRVLLDLVPNHTSDRHPWFAEARASRASNRRDWYVWADPRPDGSPPNNWLSAFGGPAWTLDEPTGQAYLHGFLPEQPDLNWWNEDVRDEFDRILRFWFDRGIAGFRIDVAHRIVTDERLRDNLPIAEDDHPHVRRLGQRQTYTASQPEVHEVFRRWRRLADAYDPPRVLLGETYVLEPDVLARYYGVAGDELHLAFNFLFLHSQLEAGELRSVVETWERALPAGAWPVWAASNHDGGRFVTRWCGDDRRKARAALVLLLTLRGTPVLYYGDEIGLPEVEVPRDRILDPVGRRAWPGRGRDVARTPMHWEPNDGGGFTGAPAAAWLPLGDTRTVNVADQQRDRGSLLHLCRDLLALRRRVAALRRGVYEPLPAPAGVWAWRRGDTVAVAVNLSDERATLEEAALVGTVGLGTVRTREGQQVHGTLALEPWEAVVVVG